jgi:hypothetical protein
MGAKLASQILAWPTRATKTKHAPKATFLIPRNKQKVFENPSI